MNARLCERLLAFREAVCRFCVSERQVFRLAFFLSLSVSVLAFFFTYDIYRDVAFVYAYYAREMGMGNWDGFWVSRVPMLQILLAGTLALAGMEAFHASIFISCTFYILTLFPLRGFLKQFLSPLQAAWGCVLFAAAPKLIRFSVSGLIDAGRYFFLIAALLLLFRLKERLSGKDLCLFGLTLAGLAVSRGEELAFSLFLLAVLPVISLSRQTWARPREWRRRLSALLLAAVFFFIGIAPFCAMNYRRAGFFVTDVRAVEPFGLRTKSASAVRGTRPAAPPVSPVKQLGTTLPNILRGGYEIYLAFALLGGILLVRRRQWDRRYSLLTVIFLLHGIFYLQFGSAYRYSIYLIPLFMPFTLTGMNFLRERYLQLPLTARTRAICGGLLFVAGSAVLAAQVRNGMECVISRDDRGKRALAAHIRQWGERNISGRRLRIAGNELPETIYWSGADAVFSYNSGAKDLRTCRDFDLLLVSEFRVPELAGRTDLVELPLPNGSAKPSAKTRFRLFRVKPEPPEREEKHVQP